jgi:hypothetical protein
MMPASLRDSPKDARCLCRSSTDSDDARVNTSDCCVIRTKRLKISLLKMSAIRSRLTSQSANEAKRAATPPRFRTPTPEPAAKSP